MSDVVYYVCSNGIRIAELSDPKATDGSWWDYRVEPANGETETLIRNPAIWENSDFTIVDEHGTEPRPSQQNR